MGAYKDALIEMDYLIDELYRWARKNDVSYDEKRRLHAKLTHLAPGFDKDLRANVVEEVDDRLYQDNKLNPDDGEIMARITRYALGE